MKKLQKRLLIVFGILLFSVISANAQTGGGKAVRVKFARGAVSAKYKGTVSHSSDVYILTAKPGQTLTIKIGGTGEGSFHIGTVPAGSKNSDDYTPISSEDLKSYTYKIETKDDVAILVGAIRGSANYILIITVK